MGNTFNSCTCLAGFWWQKIRTLGSDLGAGLKGFKKSMKDDSEDDQQNNN